MAVSQSRARDRGRRAERGRDGPALVDDLLAMASSLASSRKEYASSQLDALAASVREVSDALPALPTVKAYAEAAADNLEELASYMLESDIPDIVADARDFARRHPLATFGGTVVAGLVITQLVQSRTDALRAAVRPRRGTPRGRSRAALENEEDDKTA